MAYGGASRIRSPSKPRGACAPTLFVIAPALRIRRGNLWPPRVVTAASGAPRLAGCPIFPMSATSGAACRRLQLVQARAHYSPRPFCRPGPTSTRPFCRPGPKHRSFRRPGPTPQRGHSAGQGPQPNEVILQAGALANATCAGQGPLLNEAVRRPGPTIQRGHSAGQGPLFSEVVLQARVQYSTRSFCRPGPTT